MSDLEEVRKQIVQAFGFTAIKLSDEQLEKINDDFIDEQQTQESIDYETTTQTK